MNPQETGMTSKDMQARIVTIKIEQGRAGLFYATSPDLKGLLVAEATTEALNVAIPSAIRALYEACGIQVMVASAVTSDEAEHPWIAVPVQVARAALAEAALD